MKRIVSALTLALFLLSTFCFTAFAADQTLSLNYVPRSERGILFYLDVYSKKAVSAAVFELSYDPAVAAYTDVSCPDEKGEAIAKADGTVKIVYSHPSGRKGKLFRVAFRAADAGKVKFTLHMTQAADGDLHYLSGVSDAVKEIKLGKDDVIDDETARVMGYDLSEKGSKRSDGDSDPATGEDENDGKTAEDSGALRDLTGTNGSTWFLIGAAAAALAALAVTAGVLLRKKLHKKQAPKDDREQEDDEVISEDEAAETQDELPEPTEEPPVPEPPRPTVEEIFKEIE